jgi:hypothetical protein
MGETRTAYRFFVVAPAEDPLGKPTRKLEDNINT